MWGEGSAGITDCETRTLRPQRSWSEEGWGKRQLQASELLLLIHSHFLSLGRSPLDSGVLAKRGSWVSWIRASGNFQRWWPHAARLLLGKNVGSSRPMTESFRACWSSLNFLGKLLNMDALPYLDRIQLERKRSPDNNNNNNSGKHITFIYYMSESIMWSLYVLTQFILTKTLWDQCYYFSVLQIKNLRHKMVNCLRSQS